MKPHEEVLSPPFLKVTLTNHGAWVILSSCLLLILSVIVVLVTLISRARVLRKLVLCDMFLSLATVVFPNFYSNPSEAIYTDLVCCS